jgi:threonine/homoserine efflux transporter RhtA
MWLSMPVVDPVSLIDEVLPKAGPLFAGGILNRRYAWDSAAVFAIPLSMLAVLAIIAGGIVLSERLIEVRWLRVAVLTTSVLITAFCFPQSG